MKNFRSPPTELLDLRVFNWYLEDIEITRQIERLETGIDTPIEGLRLEVFTSKWVWKRVTTFKFKMTWKQIFKLWWYYARSWK